MSNTITVILAIVVISFFGFKSYTLNTELEDANLSIADLKSEVAKKNQAYKAFEKEKKKEIADLNADLAAREKRGLTDENLAAKDAEIAGLESTVEEKEAQIKKGLDLLQKQKDKLSWYQAELRKAQTYMKQRR